MNDEEFVEEVTARLDDLKGVPSQSLFDLVTREGVCMWVDLSIEEPTWSGDNAVTDRELAANICGGCSVADECLELEFRSTGFTTLGVWGALAEDDQRVIYLAWLQRREEGRR
jgi:WhiB family redox-sensing transcriptional regulator